MTLCPSIDVFILVFSSHSFFICYFLNSLSLFLPPSHPRAIYLYLSMTLSQHVTARLSLPVSVFLSFSVCVTDFLCYVSSECISLLTLITLKSLSVVIHIPLSSLPPLSVAAPSLLFSSLFSSTLLFYILLYTALLYSTLLHIVLLNSNLLLSTRTPLSSSSLTSL